ncbi:hypothetical protein B0J11DRAFT_514330 [Dendryphion nanum]|uniref:Uncharacterized protein n=1 Tax=Dendryphion nanum TaxID=256645 RepID=A0A9P9EJ31_9PLEO|nr:hypothetical protein B0J11DRAFT_514330 [Dendryphion nanum]
MQLLQFLVVIPAILAATSAVPAADHTVQIREEMSLMAGCNNQVGRCDKNGCTPKFANAWSLIGYCTKGTYKDCPCDKCNNQTDKCSKNGCNGSRGICQSGKYQGCQCN